jgi:hypothetical protein
MTSAIDPSRVLLTGENPFIRLSETDNAPLTTNISFWRMIFSPGGPGHVLFLQSELTDDEPRMYTDNINMARWLQDGIERSINANFGSLDLPWTEAVFESSGDIRSYWTESVQSSDEDIALTWYALGEPLLSHTLPGSNPDRPYGVCTLLIPADGVQVSINGEFAKGRPFPRERAGRKFSTCALAFSESWTLPF